MRDWTFGFRLAVILLFVVLVLLSVFGGGCAPSRELRAVAATQEAVLIDYVAVANLSLERDPVLAGATHDADYWIAVGEKLVRNQGDISDLLGVKRAK